MNTPIMTTPTAAMVTTDAIPTPTVSTIIPGLSDTYFYIIVGVGGSAVCVLLIGFLVTHTHTHTQRNSLKWP